MYIDDKGIELTNATIKGSIPTLKAGTYDGFFGGVETKDEEQVVIVTTLNGEAHIESSNLDCTDFNTGEPITFTVKNTEGIRVYLKGDRYRLANQDGTTLAGWFSREELDKYVRANPVQAYEPKLTAVEKRDD